VLEPGCNELSPSYDAFLRALRDEGLPVRHPRAGAKIFAADLRIDVLAPAGCWTATASDPNNDSLVLRVSIGDDVVLFPGDAEEPSQDGMLEAGVPIAAELKVPHHGGDTRSRGSPGRGRPGRRGQRGAAERLRPSGPGGFQTLRDADPRCCGRTSSAT
jgi:beta-lactamase superfamily II metal-dependent hydrolase